MIIDTARRTDLSLGAVRNRSAIQLVQSSRFAQWVARMVVLMMCFACVAITFLPWQQTSRGTGAVVAYVPQERQQTVQSPIKGVVERIADGLVEGSEVKKGDFLLELQPAAADLVEQLNGQLREFRTKEETLNVKVQAYRDNILGFTEARDFAVQAAQELVESARAKLASKVDLRPAYEAKEWQARLDYERQRDLFDRGLKPEREIEKLKKEWDVAKAELESLKGDIVSLERELSAKGKELEEKRSVAQTKIDYAVAMEQGALGELATVRKDIREIDIKLSELNRTEITAPRDGTIYRMPVFERGQTVKEGEALLTLVPEISQMAAELYIPGNDMPLVQIGDKVRLQFEGWPAVQFVGWPSVAVGTFGGVVAAVDATDNGKGQFRVMVLPDKEDQEWPSERFLRQGVRTNGWVMLRRVSLGYEIWRQLNGFPVIVSDSAPDKTAVKVPKLPKQ